MGRGGYRVRAAVEASHLRSLLDAVVDGLTARARPLRIDAGSILHREGDGTAHFDLVVSDLRRTASG